jgi:hypothetical protein
LGLQSRPKCPASLSLFSLVSMGSKFLSHRQS